MFHKIDRFVNIINVLFTLGLLKLRGRSNEMNDAVFDRLQELGGLYVKFLQILVLKPGFFDSMNSEHMTVFDQVPFEPISMREVLRSLPRSVAMDLQIESDKPIAAGSFAQVYAALYRGKPVVVKVLRPSVKKYLRFDQKMIKLLSFFVSGLSKYKDYAINEVVKQFIETTTAEINYRSEVRKATDLYSLFKDHPTIVIPYTHREACSESIIVQERLFGTPFTSLLETKPDYCKSEEFKELLIELGYQTMLGTLRGEKIHADPHPGNVMLLEDGTKLGLIDFGISADAPSNRAGFFELVKSYDSYYKGTFDFEEFFVSIFRFYAPDLYKSITTFDALYGSSHLEQIQKHAREVFDSRRYDADVLLYLKEARIRELFISVINKNNAFGLDIVLDGGVMQMGASTYIKLLEGFDLKFSVMPAAYDRTVRYVETFGLRDMTDSHHYSTEEMAQTFESWFGKIAESNPLLFNQISKYARGV